MVTVSVTLYGDAANQLEKALGKTEGVVTLPMTAVFEIRNVEGRSKVCARFVGEDPQPEQTTEQREKAALELEAECARLRAELKGFLHEA